MTLNRKSYSVFVLLALASLVLAACGGAATTAAPAPTSPPATTAPTAEPPTEVPPTPEPTEVPLGSAERPIVMAIAPSATTDELIASGDIIAKLLSDETGLTIEPVVPTNYKAMIEAMCSGNAQVGWLPPFAYLVAHQTQVGDTACADVAFITLRNGLDHYATQFVAHVDSGFTVAEPGSDPKAALAQFDGMKPCWTDPFSASGYVIPASLVADAGAKAKTAAFVQGHPTVIRALYAKGICDFGATFVDARTNSAIQTDLPDVNEKIAVVYQTDNIIPNDTVGYAYDVPAELRDTLSAAFEKIAATEEGAAAMKKLYSIDGLQATDDTFFDEFRVLLAASGIDIASLVR